jgi:hypothetical protein
MQKVFYEKILPAQGTYCVTGITVDGKATNHFASSVPEVLKLIDDLKDHENVFVTPHSFNGHSRKAADALYCRSFFIDLDVGSGPKKYLTQEEAVRELVSFVDEAELPQPVVINSGTGVHAYWIVDEDIPSTEWLTYASKFKQYCLEKLRIDPAVTADRARVMRAPETFNYKTNPRCATKFWSDEIHVYSTQEFKNFLGIEPVDNIFAGIEPGLDADTEAVKNYKSNEDIESVFQIIVEKSLTGRGCAQIRYIIENAKTLPEPLWHSGISIARQCTDWETAIHLMSEDYPGYSYDDTKRKAEVTYGKPHSCKVFEDRNPGGCDNCSFRGTITNPLALGRHVKEDSATNPVRLITNPKNIPPVFPAALKPFFRGAHGGVWYKPPAFRDKKGDLHEEDPILISQYDIYPVKRIYHPMEGACLQWRYVLPMDPYREFQTPLKLVHSKEEMIKLFSEHELMFSPPSKAVLFMEYIVRWSQHLLGSDAAEQMRMQMGWTDDLDGFVIGDTEIRRNGAVLKAAASPMIGIVAKVLHPNGTLNGWKEAIKELNAPTMEIHAFALFCGFGAPLMRFMSTNGVTFGFTGDSGAGKTGALNCAISIFGDPREMGATGDKTQATGNALIAIYMALKNIMMTLDECSNRDPKDVSNIVYQTASGKGKFRMQASKNALREVERSAQTITMTTQNQSLYDKLHRDKDNPDGEMARYVEFQVPEPLAMKLDPLLGRRCFEGVKENYGHAGPAYIKYLFQIGDHKINETIAKWLERFAKSFGRLNAFRFYENLIGAAFAGADLAKQANLIDLDIERVYTEVMKHMLKLKVDVKINEVDYANILGEFQMRNHQNILVISKGNIVKEPKGPLVARADVDNNIFFIVKRVLRKDLAEAQINSRMFYETARAEGLIVFDGKMRMAKGWASMSDMAPVDAVGFRYDFSKEKI